MNNKNRISWSQFKQWRVCPHRWKLNYIDGLRKFDRNIYTMFGSAMHTVVQEYLRVMYAETIKSADSLDLNLMLRKELKKLFIEAQKEMGKNICTLEDMTEFYLDGVEILDYLKKKRALFFSKQGYELSGIELKLEYDLDNNVQYLGYIDLIIKDMIHNRIKIYDIKTSTKGWNKWQKADKTSTDQLLLYKKMYADQHNFPIDNIDIEFFVLKRKLYENVDFPQRRVQKVIPASGRISMSKLEKDFNTFISECFKKDGEYNTVNTYRKEPSANNCRFCEFRNDNTLCDRRV